MLSVIEQPKGGHAREANLTRGTLLGKASLHAWDG
jgi:hypothetical protein